MSKACTKCGETKPLDGFYRDKRNADGRQSHCKECRLESARRYHEENRDIITQGKKMRRAQYMRASNLFASKKGVPYSPDEDAFLMADNGMSVYQKAVELGRTYASCSSRRKYLRSRAHN